MRRRPPTPGCTRSSSTVTARCVGSTTGGRACLRATAMTGRKRYAPIAAAFEGLRAKSAVIDGEICVQDGRGLTSLGTLQDAPRQRRHGEADLLRFRPVVFGRPRSCRRGVDGAQGGLGGADRRHRRRHRAGPVQRSCARRRPGVFRTGAAPCRWKGSSRSAPTRTIHPAARRAGSRQNVWRPRTSPSSAMPRARLPGGLAALLLADTGSDGLRYVGKVGTGWSAPQARALTEALDEHRRKTPPLVVPKGVGGKDTVWVKPKLLAEVEYAARTRDDMLRHAVYKGMRPDKAPAGGAAAASRKRHVTDADLANIWITNPDRVMFGAGGPTKLDLAVYLCPGRRLDDPRGRGTAADPHSLPLGRARRHVLPTPRHARHAGGDQAHCPARGRLARTHRLPLCRRCQGPVGAGPVRRRPSSTPGAAGSTSPSVPIA